MLHGSFFFQNFFRLLFENFFACLRLSLGLLKVDQRHGYFLPIAALHAVVTDAVLLDRVFPHELEAAVRHIQLEIRRRQSGSQEQEDYDCATHERICLQFRRFL